MTPFISNRRSRMNETKYIVAIKPHDKPHTRASRHHFKADWNGNAASKWWTLNTLEFPINLSYVYIVNIYGKQSHDCSTIVHMSWHVGSLTKLSAHRPVLVYGAATAHKSRQFVAHLYLHRIEAKRFFFSSCFPSNWFRTRIAVTVLMKYCSSSWLLRINQSWLNVMQWQYAGHMYSV